MDVTVSVDDKHLVQALCGAFESGGIRYWARIDKFTCAGSARKLFSPWDGRAPEYITHPLTDGCAVYILHEGAHGLEHTPYALTRTRVHDALRIMARRHPRSFEQLMSGRSDAETGDLLVQLACFGRLIYG